MAAPTPAPPATRLTHDTLVPQKNTKKQSATGYVRQSEAVHVAIGPVVAATAPALPATLPANTSLNYMQPNFEFRPSATTFTG